MSINIDMRLKLKQKSPRASFIENPAVDEAIIGLIDGKITYSKSKLLSLYSEFSQDIDDILIPELNKRYEEYVLGVTKSLTDVGTNVATGYNPDYDGKIKSFERGNNTETAESIGKAVESLESVPLPPVIVDDEGIW